MVNNKINQYWNQTIYYNNISILNAAIWYKLQNITTNACITGYFVCPVA